MSSSAKSGGSNILRSVLSTVHGFCLLYVSIFQICSSLTSVGREKEVGSALVLSLSPASLRGSCVFAFLYRHNTHAFRSAPARLELCPAAAHPRRWSKGLAMWRSRSVAFYLQWTLKHIYIYFCSGRRKNFSKILVHTGVKFLKLGPWKPLQLFGQLANG